MANQRISLSNFLTKDLAKRLAVAIPLGVAAVILSMGFGMGSKVMTFLLGVGAMMFADWLFSTRSERARRIEQVTALFREHGTTAVEWSMYIAASTWLFAATTEPSAPAVKSLISLVQMFGLLAVVIAATGTLLFRIAALGSMWSVFSGLTSRFLRGLAIYALALWTLRSFGDVLYERALANPNDAATGAAAFAIVWTIVRFSSGSLGASQSYPRSSGLAALTGSPTPKPTARDVHHTAAHEAGHALVYAALAELPADVKLVINEEPGQNGPLGYITGITDEHRLEIKSWAEWRMLAYLAGKVGEALMHGETTLGSGDDHHRWLLVARGYLASHHRGIFYAEPQNKFEQELNDSKLEALQAEHRATLQAFFALNADVFRELVDTLLQKRTMDRDDLSPVIGRVKLPAAFPRPYSVDLGLTARV